MRMAHPELSKAIRGSSTTMAALNPTPRWTTSLRQHVRSLLEFRKMLVLAAFVALPLAIVIRVRTQVAHMNATFESGGGESLGLLEAIRISGAQPIFTSILTIVAIPIAAFVWAGAVWQMVGFGKRDYFWSLPVNRPAQDLWRVAAGGAYLILALLAFAAVGTVLSHIQAIPLFPDGSWPFWLSLFAVPLGIYLLTSSAFMAARLPFLWIYGGFAGILLLLVVHSHPRLPMLRDVVEMLLIGTVPRSESLALFPTLTHGYGSGVLAWLQAYADAHGMPISEVPRGLHTVSIGLSGVQPGAVHSTWLLACTLWMIPILGGLWLAARRRI